MDRAIRWHAATCISDKTEVELFDALSRAWLTIFGPMQTLGVEEESGMGIMDYFQQMVLRAPECRFGSWELALAMWSLSIRKQICC